MLQLGEGSGVAKDNKITCHSTKSKLAFQFISKWPDILSWALCQEKVLPPPPPQLSFYYKDTCRGSYRYLWCLGPWFRLPSHRETYYIFSKTDQSSVTATHKGRYRLSAKTKYQIRWKRTSTLDPKRGGIKGWTFEEKKLYMSVFFDLEYNTDEYKG